MGKNAGKTESSGSEQWLLAHHDPLANVHSFSNCMLLLDMYSDGDYLLVLADIGCNKLKVFKGPNMIQESALSDIPTEMVSFYMDRSEPRSPAIAVASGCYVYIYKNLRPYFKFTQPSLPVNEEEQTLWDQAKEDCITCKTLKIELEKLRDTQIPLTVQSLKFLSTSAHEEETFFTTYKSTPLKRQTVITCLSTLLKSHSDSQAISYLVIGTESKQIYILDSEAYTVLTMIPVPAIPAFLTVSGLYDVEYRIIVTCRNAALYTIKRGYKEGKLCVQLPSQVVGICKISKHLIIGCMDNTLQCFSTKGKRYWSIYTQASIVALEVLDYAPKSLKAVLVAMSNCKIHVYSEKSLINTISTEECVTGMRFGRFGRDDCCLVITTKGGGFIVKVLRRTAEFHGKMVQVTGVTEAQTKKLDIPRKTKLFVDQSLREKENALAMHRAFQRDFYLFRLKTLKNFVQSLDMALGPVSADDSKNLKLNARVQGIGPRFKIVLTLQNMTLTQSSMSLLLLLEADEQLYRFTDTIINAPFLVPGITYTYTTFADCLSSKGVADSIKIFILQQGKNSPLMKAIVNMPISEGIMAA